MNWARLRWGVVQSGSRRMIQHLSLSTSFCFIADQQLWKRQTIMELTLCGCKLNIREEVRCGCELLSLLVFSKGLTFGCLARAVTEPFVSKTTAVPGFGAWLLLFCLFVIEGTRALTFVLRQNKTL